MKKCFVDFMTDEGMTKGSRDCYCSYVKQAYELLVKPHTLRTYPTIYDRLIIYTKRSRVKFCDYLISLLNVEIQSPLSTVNKALLQKYKSGMTMMSRFVASGAYPHNGKKQFTTKFSISYTVDELIDNFTFRIETQDRIYSSGNCFPCRLLGRNIFSRKSIYHKQYLDLLNKTFYKTKFLVNDQRDYITLENIDELNILRGIKVRSKEKNYNVFTDSFSDKSYIGCMPTSGKILEDLSLDHEEPLENIVNREIYHLPELKRLSDAFWIYHKSTGFAGTALTTAFFKKIYGTLAINEKQLLVDITEIYKHIELTIMDKTINSALGNKIIPTPPLGADLCSNQKNVFIKALNSHLKIFRRDKENTTNALLQEKEGFDFDIDLVLDEWAKNVGVNYLIIDVACATQKDIDEIESHWNIPTVYFFKNYGDESEKKYRNKISCFIKDRILGFCCSDDPEPQVVLCFVTVSKDKPIRDFYEQQVFFDHYDF